MRIKIDSGIYLSVIPTQQFKTTQISIQFLAPLRREAVGARTLLTSMLETSSARYPTQDLLAAELEHLYGASFGIGVARSGQIHRVAADIRVLADAYTDRPLFPEACQFLQDVLQHPNVRDNQFDAETFAREKENLMTYMAAMNDDRGTQAALAVQQAYFNDPAQAVPSFGETKDLVHLTAADLMTAYQEMMANDQIEIIVLGNVDEAEVTTAIRAMALPPRPEVKLNPTYDQPVHGGLRLFQETENVNQSKLNMAYHVESDNFGPQYYGALLACELFGGSPLSLLFRNVREKASLAYYASASIGLSRHLMLVQTGIDARNRQQAEHLIQAQLQAVATGQFTDEHLEDIKTGLLSERRAALDSPRYLKDQAIRSALYPDADLRPETEMANIAAVTREDVERAAQTMQLQALYYLKGDAD